MQLGSGPFEVQLQASLALHEGRVAELATGEGKTLAAVLPACLHAFQGCGVHVLTFNDYLARRDAAWMGPIYERFGLRVGVIQAGMGPNQRRQAYQADVTYATAKEVGFDLLRDDLARSAADRVLRPFSLAIVDEADSILIDEARIPLVIAGQVNAGRPGRDQLARLVADLAPGEDVETDSACRNVFLTEAGLARLEKRLAHGNLHVPENVALLADLHQALHAAFLLRRDVDYIVRDGRIEIVDELTGRVVQDRHWPDGLQAAVEAKEAVPPSAGGSVLGSISLQHFLNLYPALAGMTATARAVADDLDAFYGLEVAVIPPHRPSIRIDRPDRIFARRADLRRAICEEIAREHARGRPVLVGTASVADSEELAAELCSAGIECEVLNARADEAEAAIVGRAGAPGAVTISTNMAGRGTDILLGGPREEERERVVTQGGLYVIGGQRHESRRIDNQLRGRAGRQGDPGESRFFVSLEDDLFTRYGIRAALSRQLRDGGAAEEDPNEDPSAARELARAQRIVEGQHHEMRKTLWRYSSFVERQRIHLQSLRNESLECPDNLERLLRLHHLDGLWAEHLDQLAFLRETVILASVGGKAPLDEFSRIAAQAFEERLGELEARIEAHRAALLATDDRDAALEQIRGPSSTWTYLVNDDQFEMNLWLLHGSPLGGLPVMAAFLNPFLTLWALLQRWLRRKKDR